MVSLNIQQARGLVPGLALVLALALAGYGLASFPLLSVLGPLTIALIGGILWRATAGLPAMMIPGTRFSARPVLRAGIVLMGARLDYGLVAQAGIKVLVLDLTMIILGIVGIAWLAKRAGIPGKLGVLLAVGTSICGASAVVAAGPVSKASDEEVTLAVALCGILGTAGVFFYMLVGPLLGLSTLQLGILAGSTLHEVAQVMAAAFSWGLAPGDMGTLVKLTRVVMLAPTLVILGLIVGGRTRWSWREPPIPWFVLGFLAVGALGSLGLLASWKPVLSQASVFLMVMAMAAMGLSTPLDKVRQAGMRTLYVGFAGFLGLAIASWSLIRLLGI